ncbi:MAG: hypothetical protein LBL96_10705 [Clostridiales bacterium]|jgi:hypothetical protein|nr:hypothetical protein [Clostridiales bacterium]
MKNLVVYYSKTGHTRNAAEKVIASLNCDKDEITYDAASKAVTASRNPANYDRVIVCCPIHAFNLPQPVALYLTINKDKIKSYSLLVTCRLGGLKSCVANATRILGKKPLASLKINANAIPAGKYDVRPIIQSS